VAGALRSIVNFVGECVNSLSLQKVVQYSGGKADREIIRKYEFYYNTADQCKRKQLKFDVLLVGVPLQFQPPPSFKLSCSCEMCRLYAFVL
jgi:hypothetical protein